MSCSLAFFGATSLLAKEMRALLSGRGFGARGVRLYDTAGEGTLGEYDGEALVVTRPDEEAILDLDIAFLCGTPREMEPYLDWSSRRRYVAIDMSGVSRGRDGVPLVHAAINLHAIESTGRTDATGLIGAPHPVSHNLVSLLMAFKQAGAIHAVSAFAVRPASELGEKGLDELYQQTVALLAFGSVPQEVFGRQLAFNLIPSSGLAAAEEAGFDTRIELETAALASLEPGCIRVSSAFASVFHGHMLAVTIEFEHPTDLTELRSRISATRVLRLIDDPEAFSPVDLAGEEEISVLGVRPATGRSTSISLWSFCDNLKGGAALNAVQIAERLAELKETRR